MNKFLAIRLNYSFHVPLCCQKYEHEILIEEKMSWKIQISKLLYEMEKTVWTTRKHISAFYIMI